MKSDVVALGEILIDFGTEKTDAAGYPVMAAHPGGAPANFLAAIQRAGLQTAMIGKVGTDAFGKLLVGTLESFGIETRGVIRDDSVFTTLAFVTFDASGDRSFSFARKPGADTCLTADEIDRTLIDECRAFHFGTLSLTNEPARSATEEAVAYAKGTGKLISFDPNLRESLWADLEDAKRAMLWGLGQADVIKISDDEVRFLFGLEPEEGAEYIFRTFAPKLVFVTCGANGCVYKNRNACGFVPAMTGIRVIDTTGAGDIFGGSALYCVLESGKAPDALTDAELKAAVGYATRVAGTSTTRPGGISSVPSHEELAAMREA